MTLAELELLLAAANVSMKVTIVQGDFWVHMRLLGSNMGTTTSNRSLEAAVQLAFHRVKLGLVTLGGDA